MESGFPSRRGEGAANRPQAGLEGHLLAQIKELNKQLDKERGVTSLPDQEDEVAEENRQRVIVVANRLPVTPRRSKETGEWRFERSSGGLVSAFLGVPNLDILWVGWVGTAVPEEEQEHIRQLLRDQEPFQCVPVFLDPEVSDHFYNGFCNNVLWPLLHYIPLSMLDAQAQLAETQWAAYQTANKVFADTVMTLEPAEEDLVWVQDYHLMLLPRYLREMQPGLSIGWFLHTPFATSEMYRTLPHREEILRGVMGADLCGFHIYDYARHFHTSCARVLGTGGTEGVTEGNEGIFDHASRRSIAVDAFPIGIDPAVFKEKLQTGVVKDKIIELQRRFDGKKVILGIDRLDYVKGIPHKLKAVEKFLQKNPKMKGKIVLLQIAVPSRVEVPGYQKLRSNVHKLVSRINGEYGTLEDVPIHYLDQSMKFEELCALYFRAEVMFVTSLRDGMNLVSFEYIACQEKNRGVLVLSEFAGAAQALGAGALLVNPYNTDEVAQALSDALNMPLKEREERFMYMSSHIHTHTSAQWAAKFVSSLRHAAQASENYDSGPFSNLDEAQMLNTHEVIASYKSCERTGGRRLLVFGLLGTLIDYAQFANLDKMLPSVRRNLAALASNELNTVVVCSGRERALMNEWLGDLPIWLVAENGLYIRAPGDEPGQEPGPWEMTREEVDDTWMQQLKPVFKYFETRTPDTLTEVQEHTMTWHFQEAAESEEREDFVEMQAGDLQAHLDQVAASAPVEVGLDMKRVEVRPYGVSKGAALALILERLSIESPARDTDDEATEPPSSPGGRAAGGGTGDGEEATPVPAPAPASSHEEEASASVPVGEASAASASATAFSTPRASIAEIDRMTGNSAVEEQRPRESPFRWVLCMCEVMARDEDLFSNLKELAEADGIEPTHVITCCVGKTLSQAQFHLAPLGSQEHQETAGLLDLLAHASIDPYSSPAPTQAQLPSVLERRRELAHVLVGKQLLFLLDYEGAPSAITAPSPTMVRFTSLYPTAVVLRAATTDDEAADSRRELFSSESVSLGALGAISGIEIASFGVRRSPAPATVSLGRKGALEAAATSAAMYTLGAAANTSSRSSGDAAAGGGSAGDGSARGVGFGSGSFGGALGGGGGLGGLSGLGGGVPDLACSLQRSASMQDGLSAKMSDSYRPALELCLAQLTEKLQPLGQVSVQDDTFSLSVIHRGASDDEVRLLREVVQETLANLPMLRAVEGRMVLEVRPEVDWSRARAVEWLVGSVVDQAGLPGAVPIYIGTDVTFQHVSHADVGGINILVTGGPGSDGYFLRSVSQVEELLRWFSEMHAAGVTVPGGKLRPQKQKPTLASGKKPPGPSGRKPGVEVVVGAPEAAPDPSHRRTASAHAGLGALRTSHGDKLP